MKRVSQLSLLALALGLSTSVFATDMAKTLSFSHLLQQNGVAIDTRMSAFYNGWPQSTNGPQGHEPMALNLSASWLSSMTDEQLATWAQQHKLQKRPPLRCTATIKITRPSRHV